MNKNYIHSFDGLRVIALLGVFFYHATPSILPSGYLGVVMFFVFAGFLSMLPLAKRADADDSVSKDSKPTLHNSLFRILIKIIKLYPSLIITLILVTVVMMISFKTFLPTYFMEALTSFLSVNNFYQILNHESYFEAMNSIKPLTHIWALSLEFQFYILFYLIIYTFYNRKNKKKFFISFIALAIISYALSFILISNGASLTRVYYGLDTRLSAFLIGVISSILADEFYNIIKRHLSLIRALELILIACIIIPMFFSFKSDLSIIVVLNIYSIIFSILLIILYNDTAKKSYISNILSFSFFNEIVTRSYIIYLVHYPVVIFTSRFTAHIEMNSIIYVLFLIILTMAISEAIYRFLLYLNLKMSSKKMMIIIYSAMLIIFVTTLTFAKVLTPEVEVIDYDTLNPIAETEPETSTAGPPAKPLVGGKQSSGLFSTTNPSIAETEPETSPASPTIAEPEPETSPQEPPREIPKNILASTLKRVQRVNEKIGGDATLDEATFFATYGFRLTVIGDSLTSSAKGSMSLYFPDSYVNSKGSREIDQALDVFLDMKEKGEIGDGIVFALGTNSSKDIDVEALDAIYNEVQKLDPKKPMIILSIVLPYRWQETERNEAIRNFVDTHEFCFLADWHAAAKTHKECFTEDNIHPTGIGLDVYSQVIYKAYVEGLRYINSTSPLTEPNVGASFTSPLAETHVGGKQSTGLFSTASP